jgi:hypothetical protein
VQPEGEDSRGEKGRERIRMSEEREHSRIFENTRQEEALDCLILIEQLKLIRIMWTLLSSWSLALIYRIGTT